MADRSDGWRNPEIGRALAYVLAQGGNGTGLSKSSEALLARLGYAERFPYRGGATIHRGLRLTREGFKAAKAPWRTGSVGLVYGGKAAPGLIPGWTLTLSCQREGLRLALVPMPAALTRSAAPRPAPPAEISVHQDAGEAVAVLRDAAARARELSGVPGRLHGPGYLAWDGAVAAFEDGWEGGVDAVQVDDETVLERMAEAFPGPSSPRP